MNHSNNFHHLLAWLVACALLLACSLVTGSVPSAPPRFPVSQDGQGGYIDKNGKIVIEPQFDWAAKFSEGLGLVKQDNKWGYIDIKGEIVIEPRFDNAFLFKEGRARVEVDKKYGFIDTSGKLVIEAEYDDAFDFSEGIASVLKCTEKKSCTWITFTLTSGSYTFPTGGEHSYIDLKGNTVIPSAKDYASLGSFHEGLAFVRDGKKYGYIDTKGKMVIEPQFEGAGNFSEGLAPVQVGKEWGYVDAKGKTVVEPQFQSAQAFSDGLAAVQVGEEWGYIDTKGKTVIEPQFKNASYFSDGLAAIQVGDHWGYIDAKGKKVIKPQFDGAANFSDGLALIWDNGTRGDQLQRYIDTRGEIVWEPSNSIPKGSGSESEAPKAGIWKGQPHGFEMEVTSTGKIKYVSFLVITSNGFCYVDTSSVASNADGTFSVDAPHFTLTGKYETSTTASGTATLESCTSGQRFSQPMEVSWKAAWDSMSP